ncbi:MAG: hypothetical protein C0607_00550 [Azoarcus sp.]|nr:MAG: hypothetical protein C0607_00550 [Azoarcus sp.]
MTDFKHRAQARHDAAIEANPWLEPKKLQRLTSRIQVENASLKTRRQKLVLVADRFNAALAPHVACKPGCAGCCSMTTMIYAHEAEAMAQASGRAMASVPVRPFNVALNEARRFHGIPCPFQHENRCSIYAARPLICRIHHSLNDDASACDTSVPFEERKPVASYDVDRIELPYHCLMTENGTKEAWGAIQEFFPG